MVFYYRCTTFFIAFLPKKGDVLQADTTVQTFVAGKSKTSCSAYTDYTDTLFNLQDVASTPLSHVCICNYVSMTSIYMYVISTNRMCDHSKVSSNRGDSND